MPVPSQDMFARSKFLTAPVKITLSDTNSLASALLPFGMYLVYATAACSILQGASNVAATADTVPLPAGVYFGPIHVDATANAYIAAKVATGTGAVYLIRCES